MRLELSGRGRDLGIALLAFGATPLLRIALPIVGVRTMRATLGAVRIRRLGCSFPARFKSWQDALTPVSDFSHSYGAD